MPDADVQRDAEIIHAAYAERVSEAFKIFAENLATGQGEAACKERFRRAMMLVRKTRDLAMQAITEGAIDEPAAIQAKLAAEAAATPAEALSAEDQAMIDQALAGTTGHMPATPVQRYRGR